MKQFQTTARARCANTSFRLEFKLQLVCSTRFQRKLKLELRTKAVQRVSKLPSEDIECSSPNSLFPLVPIFP